MAKDEIGFIKKEIERSGFPLEIEISSILKEDEWEVLPSSPYYDKDEGKWREIDIKAYKSAERSSQGGSIKPYRLTLALIIECKKSDEFAWVFFPQPRNEEELTQVTNIVSLDFLTVVKRQSLLKEEFHRTKLFPLPSELQFLNMDRSVVTEEAIVTPDTARNMKFLSELKIISPGAFRHLAREMKAVTYKEIKLRRVSNKSAPSKIFEAINALIKATKYDLILSSSGIYAGAYLTKKKAEALSGRGGLEIDIFLPILIFDGKLYSWVDGKVKRENEVLLEGRCHTSYYFENMLINVVTKEHFKRFLSSIDEDFIKLADCIYENKAKLDEQTKIIMESSLW
nr:hypothetical protein [Candidatus Freyarchaeota archaeon]